MALQRIDRLTEHYRVPINLARALLHGFGPDDLFASGQTDLQLLQFSLPRLFELMVHRLVVESLGATSVTVSYQDEDLRAIVDGTGATYRAVRPDIALYVGGRPIGVIDVKFKPRYVEGYPGTVPESARVTSDDLYQLFFYQVRLQHRYGLDEPPPCLIFAPQLDEGPGYDATRRSVNWHGARAWHGLTIASIRLISALASLRRGETSQEVLASTSELQTHLDDWVRRSGNYSGNGGAMSSCPACGSSRVSFVRVASEPREWAAFEGETTGRMACRDCGFEWKRPPEE